ncbi:stealth family protein [Flavobacterium sp.]|uniref:stealth family protein n=1 Tax=Flavobacterium sp. TaxID=239 RepID=UPI00391DEA4E
MTNQSDLNFEIDVVILWVDGSDENHIKKLSQYIENKSLLDKKGFLTRYLQVDEIEYCVKSIKRFAPYVRNIYIITDNQIPSFLKNQQNQSEFENVKIIDHKVIFKGFEQYLPTFNCYPIETMMTKIPDLAEHFIYFNDDMFIIKETKPTDFFTTKGFPVLRGKWSNFDTNSFKEFLRKIGIKKRRISKVTYKKSQENSAKILGMKQYLKVSHTPFPMRKSTFNDYLDKNTDIMVNSIKHRFRDSSHFMIQLHAAHLEILNNTCELKKNYKLVHFGSTEKSMLWIKLKLFLTEKDQNKLFLNIQSLDLYPEEKLNYILNWLDKLLQKNKDES